MMQVLMEKYLINGKESLVLVLKDGKKQPSNKWRLKRFVKTKIRELPSTSTTQEKEKEQDATDNEVEMIKQKSAREASLKEIALRLHKRKLQTLVKSNGFKIIPVKADGNCLFEATAIQVNPNEYNENAKAAVNNMRNKICTHIEEKSDYYRSFTEHDFLKSLKELKRNGRWNNTLGDVIPLAIANTLKCQLTIYSSKPGQAVIDINPTLTEQQDIAENRLVYAYMAMRGCEHYDACQKISFLHRTNTSTTASNGEKINQSPILQSSEEDEGNECNPVTPRKAATFVSPKRKPSSRKKNPMPHRWKKNIRKQLRLEGKEYISSRGKAIKARQLKPHNCSKCRYKCPSKVSEEDRMNIFNNYWSLKSVERQKDFICQNVIEKQTRQGSGKKTVAHTFTLTCSKTRHRVCKNFFLRTLDIGERTVYHNLSNQEYGMYTSSDRRGKHTPTNKTPEHKLRSVKEHIESFPLLDPHYTRKDSNRRFLGSDLSINKMYYLYKEVCAAKGETPVSKGIHRKEFCNNYNYSFHVPKKDQCSKCNKYNQAKLENTLSTEDEETFQLHQQNKVLAREEKRKDKKSAETNREYYCATFDLQAVLSTPCSRVSQVYYKRKLNSYNLTVYSLSNKAGTCYIWNETEGMRGSCEIATCINLHLKSLPVNIKHVCLYSDSCIGQNRNRYMALALLHTLCEERGVNFDIIDHKFLESGHTYMEVDSMHAACEHAKRYTNIYVPSQWDTILQMARRTQPYFVVPLKFWDFKDFKKLANDNYNVNFKTDIAGNRISWLDIKWLRVRRNAPDTIYFKTSFEEDFRAIIVRKVSTRTSRGKTTNIELSTKYTEKIPISAAKQKDLLSLCKDLTIPSEYHTYYKQLPVCNKRDRLADPDIDEDDVDTD